MPTSAATSPAGGDRPAFANPPQVPDGPQPYVSYRLPEDEGMPYTPLTKLALRLSFAAHEHQRDKSGLPYVYHPFHLADQMRTEEAACVALLHDVVEDGHLTFEKLAQAGMPPVVVEAVRALSHPAGVPYMDYVVTLRSNELARQVKLADLRHNANLSRLGRPLKADHQRRIKYRIAQALLDDSADSYDRSQGQWRKRIPLDDRRLCYLSVFYQPDGTWLSCSLDVEEASDSHYVFDAAYCGQLWASLGRDTSLPEGLARLVDEGGPWLASLAIREAGVPLREFHYD